MRRVCTCIGAKPSYICARHADKIRLIISQMLNQIRLYLIGVYEAGMTGKLIKVGVCAPLDQVLGHIGTPIGKWLLELNKQAVVAIDGKLCIDWQPGLLGYLEIRLHPLVELDLAIDVFELLVVLLDLLWTQQRHIQIVKDLMQILLQFIQD